MKLMAWVRTILISPLLLVAVVVIASLYYLDVAVERWTGKKAYLGDR